MIYHLSISGMSCNHCKASVEKALSAMPGVKSVIVSLEEHSATMETTVAYTREVLFEALDDAGYELTDIKENQ